MDLNELRKKVYEVNIKKRITELKTKIVDENNTDLKTIIGEVKTQYMKVITDFKNDPDNPQWEDFIRGGQDTQPEREQGGEKGQEGEPEQEQGEKKSSRSTLRQAARKVQMANKFKQPTTPDGSPRAPPPRRQFRGSVAAIEAARKAAKKFKSGIKQVDAGDGSDGAADVAAADENKDAFDNVNDPNDSTIQDLNEARRKIEEKREEKIKNCEEDENGQPTGKKYNVDGECVGSSESAAPAADDGSDGTYVVPATDDEVKEQPPPPPRKKTLSGIMTAMDAARKFKSGIKQVDAGDGSDGAADVAAADENKDAFDNVNDPNDSTIQDLNEARRKIEEKREEKIKNCEEDENGQPTGKKYNVDGECVGSSESAAPAADDAQPQTFEAVDDNSSKTQSAAPAAQNKGKLKEKVKKMMVARKMNEYKISEVQNKMADAKNETTDILNKQRKEQKEKMLRRLEHKRARKKTADEVPAAPADEVSAAPAAADEVSAATAGENKYPAAPAPAKAEDGVYGGQRRKKKTRKSRKKNKKSKKNKSKKNKSKKKRRRKKKKN